MVKTRGSLSQTGPSESGQSSTLVVIGTSVAILGVLYLAKEIFIPFAFALALSFILTPAATWR